MSFFSSMTQLNHIFDSFYNLNVIPIPPFVATEVKQFAIKQNIIYLCCMTKTFKSDLVL